MQRQIGVVGTIGVSVLHGGTMVARIGESGFRDFVHGTSEAHCWPPIVPVEDHPDRVRRSWVVRLAQPLPPDVDVKAVGQRVEVRARNKITETLEPYYSGDELELSFPGVKLVVVDAMHALAHIVTRQPEKDITDAGMIAITQVLRGLDAEWDIEDLQGSPKRFWLLLASVER